MFSTGAEQRQDRLENMPCSVQRSAMGIRWKLPLLRKDEVVS